MEFKDYYKIMGVKRDATQDEIKRAYRKLARKYHPDVSKEPDAEARFKEVGEAYEVLKDPEKRAAYDQLGANWKAGQEFHPPPDWDQGFEFHGGGFTGAGAEGFSDFFESLFGRGFAWSGSGAGRTEFSARGQDTYARVLIDLEDAYHGGTRLLTLKHTELGADNRPHIQERTLNVHIPKGYTRGSTSVWPDRVGPVSARVRPATCTWRLNSGRILSIMSRARMSFWICPWRPGRRPWVRKSRCRRPLGRLT